jgi:hypothetical protein
MPISVTLVTLLRMVRIWTRTTPGIRTTTWVWVSLEQIAKMTLGVIFCFPQVLMTRLQEKIFDPVVLSLIINVIMSFDTQKGKGLPLGNLTSQICTNIYMDMFDQYVKRGLGIKYYIRYADDFIILTETKEELSNILTLLQIFLREKLQLTIHPNKVSVRTWRQGIDVLGYISYPTHRSIRTKTKQRIRKKVKQMTQLINQEKFDQTIASYNSRIKHCWSKKLNEYLNLMKIAK